MRVESNIDPPLIDLGAPEIFADGISKAVLRGGTVKFVLFSWRCSPVGGTELREVVTIAMPLAGVPGGIAGLRENLGPLFHEEDAPEIQPTICIH